jgi:hypothetical protein
MDAETTKAAEPADAAAPAAANQSAAPADAAKGEGNLPKYVTANPEKAAPVPEQVQGLAQPGIAKPPAAAQASPIPKRCFVLDTTAVNGAPPRIHEHIIDGKKKSFTFHAEKPLEMSFAEAMKFVKDSAFKLCDEVGNLLEFQRRPKQQEELQAGERIVIGEGQTIANYEELTTVALFRRAVELPGGEQFSVDQKPDRDKLVAFIKSTTAALKKQNTSKERDRGFATAAATDEETAGDVADDD